MTRTTLLAPLFALLLGTSLMAQTPAQAPKPAQEQELVFELKAPGEPTLHILHTDNGLKIKEYPGKVIMLNFFGKNCKWCMKEIPHLVALQKEYKGKLQIVAIHSQESMTPGERHLLDKRFHFDYPIYEYQDNVDFVRYIAMRTGWQGGLPLTLVFDANGDFVYKFPGYAPMEDLKKVIDFAIESTKKGQ
ncbi:TlpA family protein disulfide reductase [Hydrogenimonas sp.]